MMTIMNHRKKSLGGSRKSLLLRAVFVAVLLFHSLIFSIWLQPQPVNAVEDFSSQLNADIPEPNTTIEHGIWVDRALIILFNASTEWSEDLENQTSSYSTKGDEGLNQGPIKYISDEDSCSEITVTFRGLKDRPTSGSLKKCDGTNIDVSLKGNFENAFVDGYYYEDGAGETKIEMPRYLGGINNCEQPANRVGVYKQNGEFSAVSADKFNLTSGGGTDRGTVVEELSSDGAGRMKARQKSVGAGPVRVGDDCDLTYAGDSGVSGGSGRDIYLLKSYDRKSVTQAALDKVSEYNTRRGRTSLLNDYFAGSPAGVTDIQTCKDGTGTTGSRADIVNLLATRDPGTDPFVDCMLRELEGDEAFEAALSYSYEAFFEENLIVDTQDNCEGGIPIVSELVCSMLEGVYDGLYEGFEAVI
jgi:hypothetical protein